MLQKASWAIIVLALFAAACSGAHQSVSPGPPAIPQAADRSLPDSTSALSTNADDLAGPLVAVTASVVVTVPTSASAAKSISIKVNTGTPVIANLSSTSPGCSGTNPVVCTLSVSATTGLDLFAFKTFNGSNGTGSVLATGSVLQTITTTSKTVHITLAGTPKGITLALKRTGPFECNGSTSIPLYPMVMDASANVIIGAYGESVTLTDSDTSGKTSLTLTSVSSSASTVNVTYNGLPLVNAIFSASASGVPPSAVHPATLKPAALMFVSTAQGPPWVAVFPPAANGNVAPLRSMDWSGMSFDGNSIGITVDSNCTLYTTNDDASGSDVTGGPEVDKFPATASGGATPSAVIGGNLTHLGSSLAHVAVGTAGKVYVVNPQPSPTGSPAVEVFAAGTSGNVAPIVTISGSNTGFQNPRGIAIDASGKIYVVDPPSVFVFAAGANGNVSPVATISGNLTTLTFPEAVALDSAGRIYVDEQNFGASCTGGAIDVFAAGANGNVAPTRQIAGSNTLLSACGRQGGIAVDSAGNIYVANNAIPADSGVDTVLVFSSSASGNVAPRQVLSGSNTKIVNSLDIAL